METLQSFDLFPLEKGFVGAKPIEKANDSVFLELERNDNLIIERKRNGHAALVPVTGFGRERRIELYSRGISSLSSRFPALVEELREMNIPKDTLLGGEMLACVNGNDSLETFLRFVKSNPERAVALQANGSPINLVFFNVIVHKGKPVASLPYIDRLDIVRELFAKHQARALSVVEVLDESFEAAKAKSLANGWEGLVLYDKRASSTYRLDGKSEDAPRPLGCWKWKRYHTEDFVVTGWVPSTTASRLGMVKDFKIAQYNKAGELVPCGKVSSGVTVKQRKELADDSLYPMVCEIKFPHRTVKNRLSFAEIVRFRIDKTPRECVMQK